MYRLTNTSTAGYCHRLYFLVFVYVSICLVWEILLNSVKFISSHGGTVYSVSSSQLIEFTSHSYRQLASNRSEHSQGVGDRVFLSGRTRQPCK